MTLGRWVRQRRKELGYTQEQVAARAGISKPYLSNIETGRAKNPPSNRVLGRLERALGFEVDQLRRQGDLDRTPADVRAAKASAEAELARVRKILGALRDEWAGSDRPDLHEAIRQLTGSGEGVGIGPVISAGRPVPVINRVTAGYPQDFSDLDYPPRIADEYISCPDIDDPQAFAARVVGDSMTPRFAEGDIVVFAPNTPARSGQDCFIRFADTGETTFKAFYVDEDGWIRLQPRNQAYPPQRYRPEQINGIYPAKLRIEELN